MTMAVVLSSTVCAQEEVPPPFERETRAERQFDPFDPEALDPTAPKMIQVQVEYIEVGLETLSELMFLRDPKGDATGLRKEVQALIENEKAKVMETMICLARPGQKATTESLHEFIYPTEYEPAQLPSEVTVEKGVAPPALMTPPMPTAFDMEPLGSTFEIEPNIYHDGRIIEIRMSPQIVKHMGNTKWSTLKDQLGNENHIQMPDFYTMRVTTGVTMSDGTYVFLAALTAEGEDGSPDYSRKVMVFVKADVIQIGK